MTISHDPKSMLGRKYRAFDICFYKDKTKSYTFGLIQWKIPYGYRQRKVPHEKLLLAAKNNKILHLPTTENITVWLHFIFESRVRYI